MNQPNANRIRHLEVRGKDDCGRESCHKNVISRVGKTRGTYSLKVMEIDVQNQGQGRPASETWWGTAGVCVCVPSLLLLGFG